MTVTVSSRDCDVSYCLGIHICALGCQTPLRVSVSTESPPTQSLERSTSCTFNNVYYGLFADCCPCVAARCCCRLHPLSASMNIFKARQHSTHIPQSRTRNTLCPSARRRALLLLDYLFPRQKGGCTISATAQHHIRWTKKKGTKKRGLARNRTGVAGRY